MLCQLKGPFKDNISLQRGRKSEEVTYDEDNSKGINM